MAADTLYRVEILDQEIRFNLQELCQRSDMHAEFVVKLVSYGVIAPLEDSVATQNWQFDARSLMRLRKARRLQNDLNLNVPGLAISLELLDDVEQLRREVDRLNQQLRQQRGE
jgi:chaperone modulatory protein CbpM